MSTTVENRVCERKEYDCNVTVSWAYFNTDQFHTATAINYSEHGICFESDTDIEPGSNIHIRVNDCPKGAYPAITGFRSTAIAQVIWCKKVSDSDPPRYRIGVKYHGTV